LAQPFKLCPICETVNHVNAAVCVTCGTSLADVPAVTGTGAVEQSTTEYDFRYGETDLQEASLRRKAQLYLAGMAVTLAVIMCAGITLMAYPLVAQVAQQVNPPGAPDANGVSGLGLVTNTPRPTVLLPTVTLGPPTLSPTPSPTPTYTATLSPTPEPCIQQVQPLEGLYSVVGRCGHRDLFVITQVMELNDLVNDTDIRPGDTLIIPWPTPTVDPNAAPSDEPEADGEASGMEGANLAVAMARGDGGAGAATMDEVDLNATLLADPFFVPTATLPPGIQEHRVSSGENVSIIIDSYNTSIEVLQQLNPQISFSQCDFGTRYGGERCIVLLSVGQMLRVPAPTPTPTLSPTPSGSETPTPTPTATFNAPSVSSPSNRAFFRRDELVTLRWVASGALSANERYRVSVESVTADEAYTADTSDLFLIIPPEWQGRSAGRYEYRWSVAIVDLDQPDELKYATVPRAFTWEGRGDGR
jgi:LysM repeat protein